MAKLNKIVFPLTTELKTLYDLSVNSGLFNGDNLVLPIWSEDYNAANPVQTKVIKGLSAAVVDITTNYYQFEATCRDSRVAIGYILKDLMTDASTNCSQYQPITCYDYHRLDTQTDRQYGYTIRQGVLQYEPLKGSIRSSAGYNYNGGHRIIFTQTV